LTNPDELFLLGLFSLLDAMLESPMEVILEKVPVSDEIKQALNSQTGPLAPFLKTAVHYEKGQHESYLQTLEQLDIDTKDIHKLYLDAVAYADNLADL
jgi:EAL and modified HD-GYP domain-containing signal transduction protein